MLTCPKCGARINDNSLFCDACGEAVETRKQTVTKIIVKPSSQDKSVSLVKEKKTPQDTKIIKSLAEIKPETKTSSMYTSRIAIMSYIMIVLVLISLFLIGKAISTNENVQERFQGTGVLGLDLCENKYKACMDECEGEVLKTMCENDCYTQRTACQEENQTIKTD